MLQVVPWNTRANALFGNLRQEMDYLWDHFGAENGNGRKSRFYTPQVDFSETEREYEIRIDLPGVIADHCSVEYRDGHLWITGERKSETGQEGRTWHRLERHYGQFRRVIALPNDVNAEKVAAQYKDGVLRIVVPKAEAALPKKIAINPA